MQLEDVLARKGTHVVCIEPERRLMEAIAVLNLDSPPPEEALNEVRTHPQISSLSVVNLPRAGELPAWLG